MNKGLRILAICPHLKSLELTLFLHIEVIGRLTYTPSAISSENVLGGGDDQLIEDTPSETTCPNLTTIKLWGCISAQDGKVADMVESRRRRGIARTAGQRLLFNFKGQTPEREKKWPFSGKSLGVQRTFNRKLGERGFPLLMEFGECD
ncbi:uncharacterized protein LACBIDRAFT_333621 [Laccaria bicolor S238N-H82]|uniref:Predicted protein n=1 Tax=Laccaria bicolor (strain S238N-H82 / ATCC MYA-4686) TaxID=486041 RepID=B0DWJ2_LACBS|nr:uncharacterized protein LACBIDRAFT_333621 [Laccaria bicolor S238N-H82]EDR01056.1 predicted protein [Laccaria bicolor S238N-H82]|eukprot:XP_001888275.1 predicted protein [Laccaria bicolor S238N-H82]